MNNNAGNIQPVVADENNPTASNLVQVDAYRSILGLKRKIGQATIREVSSTKVYFLIYYFVTTLKTVRGSDLLQPMHI